MASAGRAALETSPFGAGWSVFASLGLHAVVLAGGGWWALHAMNHRIVRAPERAAVADAVVALELPTMTEGLLVAPRPVDPVGAVPERSGGEVVPRVDTGVVGRGGEPTVDQRATHLSDVDERLRLSPDLVSRVDRDQAQRLRSASSRASWEDRRSTTHPAELTFVVSGSGDRLERRAPAPVDPSRGVLAARAPSARGAELGAPAQPSGDEGLRAATGGRYVGSLDASPGRGVRGASPGEDHRASADVARMRPDVALGPVAVQSADKGHVRDDVDAEQEASSTVRALVHASTAGGALGAGHGGAVGGGDPGAGGDRGAGSHSAPLGDGLGDWFDIDTKDPRLLPYFRRVQARIEPLWAHAFPKSAMLELKQGTVILEFTVARDGTARVAWPPLRPSGIDEFDRNCADAIRRAAPFEPIPKEVGRETLKIRAPFVASSAIVP